MPTHGKATSVILGAFPVHQWLNSISTTETTDAAETTPFQVDDKTYIIGMTDAKLSAGGRFEGNANEIRDLVMKQIASQTDVVVTAGWGMGGPKAGNPAEFGRELVTTWQITAPIDGLVSVSLDTQIVNGLGHGNHLLDNVSRTASTTGPTVQQLAAVGAGLAWGLAVHRVAASGSAASVVKVQTSADGSTWTDLSGATASFAAGVTGSQLITGTANVAGAYVRAVETITGTGASTVLAAFGLY